MSFSVLRLTIIVYCAACTITDCHLFLQGGNTVRQLLKIAKKTVPEDEWKRTPVVLKATAGLRLLPEDKANALLKEVWHIFFLPLDSLAQTPPIPP